MTEPLKDKAHALAHQDEFRAAYERAREYFSKFPGVEGVAFGQKLVGSEYLDNISIVVFVREKKKEEDVPPEQRIPKSFEGYPTDVRVVEEGVAEVCDNQTKYEQIQGGIQIMVHGSDNNWNQGTLGCIVKKRNDRGRENMYLLTNKHVLYTNGAKAGSDVRHPGMEDDVLGPVQPGGLYGDFPYPMGNPASPSYFIDAAIARINLDSTCCGSTCSHDTVHVSETSIVDLQVNGINTMADVRDVRSDASIISKKVFKVGRTTGKTTGIVRLINAPLSADPPPDQPGGARLAVHNTIYVEFDVTSTANHLNCHGNALFTEQGDSGSILVDENNNVIGLHTHKGKATVSALLPSHACHIVPVLDYLNICIPCTTGTSHGSSLASDGFGAAVSNAAAEDVTIADGQYIFVSQAAGQEQASPPHGFPDPSPLSEQEAEHMRKLLVALRETERGRELHRMFGDVRREIGYLIRNCRPVKVAWHRNQGPAFLVHFLNHLKGHSAEVPREVQGVPLETLLLRMSEVLKVHGGDTLRAAIDKYGPEIAAAGPRLRSAQDCMEYLRESVQV